MMCAPRPCMKGSPGAPAQLVLAVALWLAASGAWAGPTVPPGALHGKADDAQTITPQRARSLFYLHCAGCHRFDGGGAPAFGVPSMVNTLGRYQLTARGRAYLVQVPGARNASVTDAELAAMTNWQMQAFSAATAPKDFKPYTTEEVRRWRHQPPADIAAARAEILAELPVSPTYESK